MRHNKRINHLSRTKAHRKAMLSNMASSLIQHKRISTTLPKAKALRGFVEPLITKAKSNTDEAHRLAFKALQNKVATKELFGVVRDKVGDRPGGYTRILKTGFRLGDNAQMCIIELVDFNEEWLGAQDKKATKTAKKTRRTRRSKASSKDAAPESETAKEVVDTTETSEEKEANKE